MHAAQEAFFATGATRPVSFRLQQLRQLKRMIDENEKVFTDALTADLGKTSLEGQITEIVVTLDEVANAMSNLTSWAAEEQVASPGALMPAFASVRPEPRGVTLVVGPFNYPMSTLLGPLVSALAAGDTAVLKPSEMCPATEGAVAALVAKYFAPEVVAVVRGGVPETTALMELEWGLVFFTGSERVARIIGVVSY